MLTAALLLFSCDSSVRDITGGVTLTDSGNETSEVIPVDITTDGLDFLEKIQGQWVGTNRVIATDFSWFAFDYRAISSSHIHGIFEGGTQGNLFTSFFVTNYKGTRTLMARNGGVLNGIYRTSYFVLDQVEDRSSQGKYYRFVDAIGGKNLMYFELRFKSDSLYFNAYTSNFRLRESITRHMTFKAKRHITDLAQTAATATGFPQNTVAWDFTSLLNSNDLYIVPGNSSPTTATFVAQQGSNDVYALASMSGDPVTINDYPRLGTITVNFTRNTAINNTDLFLYLSKASLTNVSGVLTSNLDTYNSILHYPTIERADTSSRFLFTYIHPGTYYLTIIADKDGDGFPSSGDIVSPSQIVRLGLEEHKVINVTNINVQN